MIFVPGVADSGEGRVPEPGWQREGPGGCQDNRRGDFCYSVWITTNFLGEDDLQSRVRGEVTELVLRVCRLSSVGQATSFSFWSNHRTSNSTSCQIKDIPLSTFPTAQFHCFS